MKLTILFIAMCFLNTFAIPTVHQESEILINPAENLRASIIGNFLQTINQGLANFDKVKELFEIALGGLIHSRSH